MSRSGLGSRKLAAVVFVGVVAVGVVIAVGLLTVAGGIESTAVSADGSADSVATGRLEVLRGVATVEDGLVESVALNVELAPGSGRVDLRTVSVTVVTDGGRTSYRQNTPQGEPRLFVQSLRGRDATPAVLNGTGEAARLRAVPVGGGVDLSGETQIEIYSGDTEIGEISTRLPRSPSDGVVGL